MDDKTPAAATLKDKQNAMIRESNELIAASDAAAADCKERVRRARKRIDDSLKRIAPPRKPNDPI